MTFSSSLPADNSKLRNSAAFLRNNFQALENYLGAANLASGQPLLIFPVGTRLYFHQNTAPPGWAIDTSVADCLLAVKGASGATYATGGTTAGTWQQASHQLTVDQLPSHTHPLPWNGSCGTNGGRPFGMWSYAFSGENATHSAGGDQPHDHGSDWRPKALVGIIAVKT